MSNNSELREKLDLAVIVTVVTGMLYAIGWANWKIYFVYFNVTAIQVNLPFHEVIASTWWLLMPLLLSYILIGYLTDVRYLKGSRKSTKLVIFLMNSFMSSKITLLFSLISFVIGSYLMINNELNPFIIMQGSYFLILGTNHELTFYIGFLSVILSVLIMSFYFVGEKINKNYNVFNFIALFTAALFINLLSGYVNADRVAKGTDGYLITIDHKKEIFSVQNHVLISHINGFFLVYSPNDNLSNIKPIIFNESEIQRATLISQN